MRTAGAATAHREQEPEGHGQEEQEEGAVDERRLQRGQPELPLAAVVREQERTAEEHRAQRGCRLIRQRNQTFSFPVCAQAVNLRPERSRQA